MWRFVDCDPSTPILQVERAQMCMNSNCIGKQRANALAIGNLCLWKILRQLFKRSLARVLQNRVLSRFQFAQRFYLNISPTKKEPKLDFF